jgi:hypothetical protein
VLQGCGARAFPIANTKNKPKKPSEINDINFLSIFLRNYH